MCFGRRCDTKYRIRTIHLRSGPVEQAPPKPSHQELYRPHPSRSTKALGEDKMPHKLLGMENIFLRSLCPSSLQAEREKLQGHFQAASNSLRLPPAEEFVTKYSTQRLACPWISQIQVRTGHGFPLQHFTDQFPRSQLQADIQIQADPNLPPISLVCLVFACLLLAPSSSHD